MNNYIIIFLVLLIFSKEIILINEELLLILTFFLFLIVFYNLISKFLNDELSIRVYSISNLFRESYVIKKKNLNLIKKKYEILKNIEEELQNLNKSIYYEVDILEKIIQKEKNNKILVNVINFKINNILKYYLNEKKLFLKNINLKKIFQIEKRISLKLEKNDIIEQLIKF